jgi:hypothetical protein
VLSLLIVIAISSLAAFGIFGIGRDGVFNFDGQVLYAAGRAWIQGANPYDHVALSHAVAATPAMDVSQVQFFYPPQASAICIILGLFPYPIAREIWLLVNLLAVATVVILTCLITRNETPTRWVPGACLLSAVIIGNPFTAHVLWMGQTSLVAFAATFAAWWFAGRTRWLAAGVCLGLASYKPQICMLVIFWMLLDRNWRVLITAGVSASVLALYPMVTQGPIAALLRWHEGIGAGYALESNLPSFPHKVGLESLFFAAGVPLSNTVLLCTSILITIGLWCFRTRFHYTDVLSLLMAATFTFSGYLHDYDYVALTPLFISLWRLAPPSPLAIAGGSTLIALLFVPQRLMHVFASPLMEQWRTILVVALACMIIRLSFSRSPGHGLHGIPNTTPA